jgi:hypothetical protein
MKKKLKDKKTNKNGSRARLASQRLSIDQLFAMREELASSGIDWEVSPCTGPDCLLCQELPLEARPVFGDSLH